MPDNPSSFSFDPHGYQPIIVDENCLTDSDSREALVDAFDNPCDWSGALTARELHTFEGRVSDSDGSNRSFFSVAESATTRELKFIAARTGTYRAYARNKYNEGRPVWCGDMPPWL